MSDFCNALAQQFRWLEQRFAVRVNIHDLGGITRLPGGGALLPFAEHHNPLCYYFKKSTATRRACLANKHRAHHRSCQGYYWGRCYFGFTELVVPIMLGQQDLGSIYVGQFYTSEEESRALLAKREREFGFKRGELAPLFFTKVQPLPPDHGELVTPFLFAAESLGRFYQTETMDKWLSFKPEEYASYLKGQQEAFLVSKTIDYIKENFTQDLSLDELAVYVSCSPSHLSRLFKKETGISLNHFITQTRIVAAKSLLNQTELPVTNVALETGFNDPNYFSRQFRLFTGESPTEFRQKIPSTK